MKMVNVTEMMTAVRERLSEFWLDLKQDFKEECKLTKKRVASWREKALKFHKGYMAFVGWCGRTTMRALTIILMLTVELCFMFAMCEYIMWRYPDTAMAEALANLFKVLLG